VQIQALDASFSCLVRFCQPKLEKPSAKGEGEGTVQENTRVSTDECVLDAVAQQSIRSRFPDAGNPPYSHVFRLREALRAGINYANA
jgi:hypothetical protein